MNTPAGLRRLEQILPRLTGDKALRDEAVAIVRAMIDAQAVEDTTTRWWAENGPPPEKEWRPGHPLPPKPTALFDYIVLNGPSKVAVVSSNLEIDDHYTRRLVSRADTELLNRGGKATIHISAGMIQTATTLIDVGSSMRRDG